MSFSMNRITYFFIIKILFSSLKLSLSYMGYSRRITSNYPLSSFGNTLNSNKLEGNEVITEKYVINNISNKLPIVNRNRLLISLSNPFGPKISSKQEAIDELLSICCEMNKFELLLDQQYRLEYIVMYLESIYVPIQTIPFLNMAINGKWLKLCSNLITPRACIDLEYKIFQTIQSDQYSIMNGNITETTVWKYKEEIHTSETHYSSGTLDVCSTYSINSKGDFNIDLQEHILQADTLPNNIEELLVNIQRSIPFDSFDNNMTTHSITYIDPKLRITRVFGDKFLDVFNIFIKQ